jgi:hypothetical protein
LDSIIKNLSSRPECPDCHYPLRAETGTALNSKTFLVCHMCSKGWDIDKVLQAIIDKREGK